MSHTRINSVLAAALLLWTLRPAHVTGASPDGKVAFIRAGRLYTANADGSAVRVLPTGKAAEHPKWSPDGSRIAYFVPADAGDEGTWGSLIVIAASGERIATLPVERVAPNGTPVAGLRGVETIGWLDATHVFAEGSANPYALEYRSIDIGSGKVEGFIGADFATCAERGVVAYWGPVFPYKRSMPLEISSTNSSMFAFPDGNALPTIHIGLRWADKCEYLGFIDPRGPPALVIVHNESISRTGLPESDAQAVLRGVEEGFLIGRDEELFYDTAKGSLGATPAYLRERLVERRVQRASVEKALEASDADWWWEEQP